MGRTSKNVKTTNTGHPLTSREELFIQEIVKGTNNRQAAIAAGYKTNTPSQMADTLLNKNYISEEIKFRLDQFNQDAMESGKRLFKFWWDIVDGNVKDQFGLEVDMNTRIKASQELAKRLIDIPARADGKSNSEITIKLDWSD